MKVPSWLAVVVLLPFSLLCVRLVVQFVERREIERDTFAALGLAPLPSSAAIVGQAYKRDEEREYADVTFNDSLRNIERWLNNSPGFADLPPKLSGEDIIYAVSNSTSHGNPRRGKVVIRASQGNPCLTSIYLEVETRNAELACRKAGGNYESLFGGTCTIRDNSRIFDCPPGFGNPGLQSVGFCCEENPGDWLAGRRCPRYEPTAPVRQR